MSKPDTPSTETTAETTEARQVPAWRRWASLAGAVFLGLVFLVAAGAKSLDPVAFAEEVRGYGLDFALPAMAVAVIALGIEFFLGTALVLGIRRPLVLWPTALLVVFFLFLTGRNWYLDAHGLLPETTGCGCFGSLVQRTPAEAFLQDLLLMVPALALAFLARDRGASPRIRLALVAVVTVAGVVFSSLAPGLPLDDLATRVGPGTELAGLCAGSVEDGTQTCMDAILPEALHGEHLVIVADLEDEEFRAAVPEIDAYQWSPGAPDVWVLSSATEEQLFAFRFSGGATLEVREAPEPLLRQQYRTLPRSYRVVDGVVTETWADLPPLGEGSGSDS